MFRARQNANQTPMLYTTSADFCRIFEEDMPRLYLLSFLLTADHATAEKCFVRGLEDAKKSNPVFKDWAESWARRTIIQNAIQMIRPRTTDGTTSASTSGRVRPAMTVRAEMAAVVELPAFQRFAFVMSVLERYSDHECALLLSCSRSEVLAARTSALQQIGKSADVHRKLAGIASDEQELPQHPRSAFPLQRISPLAASA